MLHVTDVTVTSPDIFNFSVCTDFVKTVLLLLYEVGKHRNVIIYQFMII